MACVAERISAMTSKLSSSVSPADDLMLPALVVGSCGCAELLLLPLPLCGGGACLKELEVSSLPQHLKSASALMHCPMPTTFALVQALALAH